MSTKIRARVFRLLDPTLPRPWAAVARPVGEDNMPSGGIDEALMTAHHSWPEAMLDAYRLLHNLDAELMDDVHASRATRREARR
ncbi:hypothetical protein [Leucobacter sp. GX0328]